MGQLLWYLGAYAATPTLLAGVLWLARRDMPRTIALLSWLALGPGLAGAAIFTVELKSLGLGIGYSIGPSVPLTESDMAWLQTLQLGHEIALTVTLTLQSAAWILTVYHAVHARHGHWLAVVVIVSGLSSVAAFFAPEVYLLSSITVFPFFANLLAVHPFLTLLLANVLPYLASAATLLYTQVGLRARDSGGLVPGAIAPPASAAPALSGLASASPHLALSAAGLDPDDDEFAIEELPRGRR